ncbi:glycosyltransferase family 39 protein [candidate division KSB1 bacterium]|nr:glycosyltransferase family 39 protein [candidate division KSB1 bacterium]
MLNITKYTYLPLLICLLMLGSPISVVESVIIFCAFLIFIILKYRNYGFNFRLVIYIAACLRFILIFTDTNIVTILPEQVDTVQYHQAAHQILENFTNHLPAFNQVEQIQSVRTYGLFLSVIFKLFGEYSILARLINAFIGILTAIFVYKICIKIFNDKKVAFLSLNLVLFWPSIIVFNSYALRDSLILYFTFYMLYTIISIAKKEKLIKNYILLFVLITLIYLLRGQNIFLYFGIFLFFTIIVLIRANINKIYKFFILSLLSLILIMIYYKFSPLIIDVATYPFRALPGRIGGGSAYLQNMIYNSYWDIIKYLPVRFFYFTFGPFLWNIHGLFQLISAFEGIIVFVCFVFLLKYFNREKLRSCENIQFFLLLFCLIGLLANSMIDSNFGTSVRHRIDYIIIFFIFSSVYLKKYKFKF